MKTPNLKTLAITAAAALFLAGYLMKSGREAVKGGKKAEDTIAGKLGLIS